MDFSHTVYKVTIQSQYAWKLQVMEDSSHDISWKNITIFGKWSRYNLFIKSHLNKGEFSKVALECNALHLMTRLGLEMFGIVGPKLFHAAASDKP